MQLISTLRENKLFFILYILLLLIGIYPLLAFNKVALFLKINSLHHPFLDQFFYYTTFLGSKYTYVLFMAVLLFKKLATRRLLIGASSFIGMSAIVQGLKRIMFSQQLRPITLIPADAPLHLVEGILPDTHLSFPSGHAATIFTAVCFIHLLAKKKHPLFSIFLILLALAVTYSRVYLCQHFYRDVYIGALIGGCTAPVVYTVLMGWKGPAWLDQSLLNLLLAKVRHKTW
jgi:membrane-associated phospholipid phosphatase